MRWTVGLLALLLLSGCSVKQTPSQDDVQEEAAMTSVPWRFDAPAALPDCGTSGELRGCTGAREPTFAVGPDGVLWATGANAVGAMSQVWYSSDLGDTWQHIDLQGTDAGRHTVGAEGDVAVDPDGTAYVFDTNLVQGWWTVFEHPLLPPTSIPYANVKAQDTSGSSIGLMPVENTDRPWLIALAPDVVFFSFNDGDTTYRITRDGGVTWSPAVHVSDCLLGVPLHVGDETFAFVSACISGGGATSPPTASEPMLSLPTATGWDEVAVITPYHDGTAPGPAALYHMELATHNGTWFVGGADEADERAYLSTMWPNGTWETEWLGPSNRSWFPTLRMREDGLLAVAYMSQENGAWALRTELRDAAGRLLNSTIADPAVIPDAERMDRRIGDFFDMEWLPDGRLAIMYGVDDVMEYGPTETASHIRFVRSHAL